jgi:hypothetical protein
MDEGALQRLLDANQIDRCPVDLEEARSRLVQARLDLGTSRAALASTERQNPKAATSLAWEAALELLLGWLSVFGYRITSERGHHATAVRAVRALLDRSEAHALLLRLDGLRRLRDNALYNNLPVEPDEVLAFLPDIDRLGDWLERAVDPGP